MSRNSSTNSISKSHSRRLLLSMSNNDRASKENKGSYSSLSSDKSIGSHDESAGIASWQWSGFVPSPSGTAGSEETAFSARRSGRRGSLHPCPQKPRFAVTAAGFQPSSPPPFGRHTVTRSRLQQQQLQQDFHKSPTPPDKRKPSVNSLFLTSTSFSSLGSLLPPAPSLSSSSFSSNWGSSSSSIRNEIMTMTIAQRSSSKEVKLMLTLLAEATEETVSEELVEAQCAMIARMALDAYYQVVISKYGGARILCHVIKHFLHNSSILESCCSTLQRMPHAPYLQQNGMIELLMSAMDYHPDSIHVQSATCATLAAILTTTNTTSSTTTATSSGTTMMDCDYSRLSELVDRAAHMFLTPAGLKSVRTLRSLLLERRQQQSLLLEQQDKL